jgi:hypothetical protein
MRYAVRKFARCLNNERCLKTSSHKLLDCFLSKGVAERVFKENLFISAPKPLIFSSFEDIKGFSILQNNNLNH